MMGDIVQRGRVAGIDYGTVRIGIALGDLEIGIATPFVTYARQNREEDAEYFRRLAADETLIKFVVGLPVHTNGRESGKSREARSFGMWLAEVSGVAVDFFDERYTTAEAEGLLFATGLSSKRRKARLDQVAAQIMLTAYFESGARGDDAPEPIDD